MKKIFLVILIFALFIGMFSYCNIVNAADEVTDREMAIAASYCYMPWFQKGKKITQGFDIGKFNSISTIANSINTKFNLHNYATADELNDWIVDDFNGLKALRQNGLNVMRLKKDNNILIAITGSFSPVDAYEDIKYGLKNYNNQEKYLKAYINNALDYYSRQSGDYNFYVTGHSLGGYLAQIAGAEIDNLISENSKYKNLKLIKIVDFNGMGINFFTFFGDKYNYGNKTNTIKTLKKLGDKGKLIEYYVYGDLVSSLGVHYGEMRMITPSIDSITYHRTNYQVLKSFGNKLVKLAEVQTPLNSFKTSLEGAEDFYKVNNIAAYLNLTHEADAFVTLNPSTSKNKPTVKIIENKTALSSHNPNSKNDIQIIKSTKLKALTSFASAKKYVWSESDDNKKWKVIKTVDLYNLNGETPTNTLDIDINSISTGKSKYYKVDSYYDDSYVPSRYNYNEKTKQYEYIETNDSMRTSDNKTSATIKVTHRKSISSMLENFISKKIKLFKR